jgi:hypothetical protein
MALLEGLLERVPFWKKDPNGYSSLLVMMYLNSITPGKLNELFDHVSVGSGCHLPTKLVRAD